ncbi:hypothetical protein PMM47T1_06826 [Pseudomonas sp. M47T1]|nr:hypothetical protein PMM47T1_06826 [Pseudomonas sp. M47T1]
MTIDSVNTLEIRSFDVLDAGFQGVLQAHVERLKGAPGCLGYALNAAATGATTWIICGYWESESQMNAHLCSQEVTQLVNLLIEAGTSLCFTCFKPNS